ncbi:MAG: EAL domain-containing protein [Candidatus Manganitrophus sp.]|nr:EAL domain-containing protein [Candidatus Manganitrophus sp.]MDC4225564.1 EAL domain-containing protein [Candidatus Manganitrophus sp.]WDT73079.1 MAG: EAL domain-containing protein [Candidatus Manganitrophus sp.]
MGRPLRVLMVEDSENDVRVIVRRLQLGGFLPVFKQVCTAEEMRSALDRESWDLVLSGFLMSNFSGFSALALLQEKKIDIPFIVVSGRIGEEAAVEISKAGAHDYVKKDRLARLVPAVERELREAEVRREREKVQAELRQSEEQLRLQSTALNSAANAVVITNSKGRILWVNPAFFRNSGYTFEEAVGQTLRLLKSGLQPPSFYDHLWKTILSGEVWQGEIINRRKDGSFYTEEMTITPVMDERGRISHFIAIKQDVTQRKKAEETVQHMAFYDPLTDLPNRNNLIDRIHHAIRAEDGGGHPIGLILIDLDRFKEVNETLGHLRGDSLLKELGLRLQSILFEPDVVAHLGADLFAVLLPKLAKAEDIHLVIEKIQKLLLSPFSIDGLPIAVEASIGVALYPGHARTSEELLRRADIAMHAAKESGSGHALYDPTLDKHHPQRLALMAELRQAIEQNHLLLHYQPKINIRDKKTVGAEALVRWNHPQQGMIPPDEFIGPAERTGLIHPMTYWLLRTAIQQCREWRQAGLDVVVSANLSARNLLDPKLPGTVVELLRDGEVAPEFIQFEITESAIMTDPAHAQKMMFTLRDIGIRFSIDDFGIGYSSLSCLQKLPVSQIKIDKSFVIHMTQNKGAAMIVRSTIDLAHNLGIDVVAEGVETEQTLNQLEEMNCDAAQGYYFSKPLPVNAFSLWLQESLWGLKKSGENSQKI